MIEQRRTPAECHHKAWPWTAALLIFCTVLFSGMYLTVRDVPEAARTFEILLVPLIIFALLLASMYYYMIYSMYRRERTRQEIEDEQRARARRYMEKFPDLAREFVREIDGV